MNKTILSNLLLGLTLTACGGGGADGQKDGSLSGNINGITGIAYSTETANGIVDAEGSFTYNEGEAITFSLGGLTLGTLDGAEVLNWHELFANTPNTAQEIRTALRSPTYSKQLSSTKTFAFTPEYATFSNNELHLTSNTVQLLLALDHDQNSDTGLDLLTGNWNTQLANYNEASIGLDSLIHNFSSGYKSMKFQQKFSVAFAMLPSKPLAYLYDEKGIEVLAKKLISSTYISGSEKKYGLNENNLFSETDYSTSSSDTKTVKTFDSDGFLVSSKYQYDNKNYESRSNTIETSYSHNSYGFTTEKNEQDTYTSSNLISFDRTYKTSYLDDRVLATSYVTIDNLESNESSDIVDVQQLNYNEAFDISEFVRSEEDKNGNTLAITSKTVFEYEDGIIKKISSFNEDEIRLDLGASIISSRLYENKKITQTVDFNDRGYYRVMSEEFDESGQILINNSLKYDAASDALLNSYITEYNFDDSNRMETCFELGDDDGDGVIDQGARITFTYNEHGLTELQYAELQDDGTYETDEEGTRLFAYGDEGQSTLDPYDNWQHNYESAATDQGMSYLVAEYLTLEANMFGDKICYL